MWRRFVDGDIIQINTRINKLCIAMGHRNIFLSRIFTVFIGTFFFFFFYNNDYLVVFVVVR